MIFEPSDHPYSKTYHLMTSLILGEILLFHLEDSIMDGDRVNLKKMDPLGRLNNNFYTHLSEIFEL